MTGEVKRLKNWRTRHIDKPLGIRVIALREARGIDRKTLAERLNISLSQMQHLEEGESRFSAPQIWQICSILALDVAEVFVDLPSHVIGKDDPAATGPSADGVREEGSTWVGPLQIRPDILALSKAARRLDPDQIAILTEMVRGMKPKRS